MKKNDQQRCDHCGKWVKPGVDLFIPTDYSDGSLAICKKCVNTYNTEYWVAWEQEKLLERNG